MYAPKQRSQSRIPVTAPKTSNNQHATGSFQVPPQAIDNSQALPEIQKYSSEKADLIAAKIGKTPPTGDAMQRMLQNSVPTSSIQSKSNTDESGDKYEQEADSMASKVMSMSDIVVQKQTSLGEKIQRKVELQLMQRPSNEAPNLTPLGERIQKKVRDQLIQRASDRSIEAGGNIESQLNSSQGGGNPLSEQVRTYMEPRFGTDFSQVRVHTGESAVQMNQELGAQAFTHGSNIYYGAGKAPGVNELTAHELTHTIQQSGGVQRNATIESRQSANSLPFAPVSVQRKTKSTKAKGKAKGKAKPKEKSSTELKADFVREQVKKGRFTDLPGTLAEGEFGPPAPGGAFWMLNGLNSS